MIGFRLIVSNTFAYTQPEYEVNCLADALSQLEEDLKHSPSESFYWLCVSEGKQDCPIEPLTETLDIKDFTIVVDIDDLAFGMDADITSDEWFKFSEEQGFEPNSGEILIYF